MKDFDNEPVKNKKLGVKNKQKDEFGKCDVCLFYINGLYLKISLY